MLVVGMPNVGKSTIINSLRAHFKQGTVYQFEDLIAGGNSAVTGPLPGVTRTISGFKVSQTPPTFLLDTPGVMIPQISREDNERGLKLALTGKVITEVSLFRSNKRFGGWDGNHCRLSVTFTKLS
jgi:ribosome biogenesis GTPase A